MTDDIFAESYGDGDDQRVTLELPCAVRMDDRGRRR